MKFKRFSALLLAAVMLLSATCFAADSSFSDVQDGATAVNADVLRLMGVVNGAGNNSFAPKDTLTRAQFCAMAVRLMGRGEEVNSYVNRTIFKDVAAGHWARGYVNLAASLTVGETGRLIAGVGDGRFLPDDAITYAQAVTILLRMLGYSDKDAGAIWPQGYLNLASTLGVGTETVAAALQPVTRAKAAQLFVSMLSAETASGGAYYASLGDVTENVFLFSVGGKDGAVRTSEGVFYPICADVSATALIGNYGALVLDQQGNLLSFVPDNTVTLRSAVLSSDAQETKLTTTDGRTYAATKEILVCNAVEGETEKESYETGYKTLMEDDAVTLALRGGKPVAILLNSRSQTWEPDEALVMTENISDAVLYPLTSGARDYTVIKDGMPVGLRAVKPYDVVTYDAERNVLTASDLRLAVVLDDVKPNFAAPETVTALGHDFPVLRSARKSLADFKRGDTVTLLLTAGGKVAGFATEDLDSTAVGYADESGVEIALPNGASIALKGSVGMHHLYRLVTVRENKQGITTTLAGTSGAPGDFNVDAMTLGGLSVTPNVRIYESVDQGKAVLHKAEDLRGMVIPQERIKRWCTNTAGAVDMLEIESVTGDLYSYGLLKIAEGKDPGKRKGSLEFSNGDGSSVYTCTVGFDHKSYGGVLFRDSATSGIRSVTGVTELTEIGGVQKTDFYQIGDRWYLKHGSTVYTVAKRVEGCLENGEIWLSRDVREICNRASGEISVYLDSFTNQVRIIVV